MSGSSFPYAGKRRMDRAFLNGFANDPYANI